MSAHSSFLEHYTMPWQVFVPVNPNYTLEWGGMEKQEKWGKYCLAAVQRGVVWLGTETKSLQEIYKFCAHERFKIGRALSHEPEYGLWRLKGDSWGAPLRCSTFSPDRLRTKDHFEALKSRFHKMPLSATNKVLIEYEDIAVGVLSYDESHMHDDGKVSEALQVYYPEPETALQLLEKADEVWQKVLSESEKKSLSAEKKYKCLGSILWFLAFSCPLEKGSAATSEMVFHVLCYRLGLPLLPIKSDKSWDIYALYSESPDKFAELFYQDFVYDIPVSEYAEYTLPMIECDHTDELKKEAAYLLTTYHAFEEQKFKGDNANFECDFSQCINLQDPYGLGLFHYWYLSLNENAAMKRYTYNKCFNFPWMYLNNGSNLFFDSVERKIFDPFVFLVDLGYCRSSEILKTEKSCLADSLSIVTKIVQHKKELDETTINLLEKVLVHMDLAYGSTDPELKGKLITLQRKIATRETLPIILDELDLIYRNIQRQSLDFSISHLMYLTKYFDCDLKHYGKISFEKWMEKHATLQGKSLLGAVLEHRNERVLSGFISNALKNERIENLVDIIAELSSKENQIFFLSAMFSQLKKEKMQSFMAQIQQKYADKEDLLNVMLLSLCQVKSRSYDQEQTICFFKVFLLMVKEPKKAIEYHDSDDKTPLYYALLNRQYYTVEQLIKAGANLDYIFLGMNTDMQEKVCDFLCSPNDDIEAKVKILLNLKNEAFQTIYIKICNRAYDNYRVDFYHGLNAAIDSCQKAFQLTFHHREDASSCLKNNLLTRLCNDIKGGNIKMVLACLQYVTALGPTDYKKLKESLDSVKCLRSNEELEMSEKLETFLQEKIDNANTVSTQKCMTI